MSEKQIMIKYLEFELYNHLDLKYLDFDFIREY